jgi:hypothetical protein
MLLIEFRKALEGEPDEPAQEQLLPAAAEPHNSAAAEQERHDLQGEWQSQLQHARDLIQRAGEERQSLDASRLADGIFACAAFLPQVTLRASGKAPVQLVLESGGRSEAIALVQESHPRSAGATLTKLTALSSSTPVVALRERAREFPPTWKETLRKQAALLETGRARWLDIEPQDCARLLALAALLQAARSGDVSDVRGIQVSEAEVQDWARSELDVAEWPLCRALLGAPELAAPGEEDEAAPSTPAASMPPPPSTDRLPPPVLEASPAPRVTGSALAILRRLRVASFERLVREVGRVEPASTRATIQAELETAGERIRWFGRSIVFFRSGE